jgi:mono/diheme cytochrome c family protein
VLIRSIFACLILSPTLGAAPLFDAPQTGERISLIGNGLGERMQYYGYFETRLHLTYPNAKLSIRNLCYPGDTPVFRPRAGRNDPWAFPEAEKIRPDLNKHRGEGHYPTDDEWLTLCKTDTILAFFGFNESFDGAQKVDRYQSELDAFITHTLSQKYNGKTAPRLVLVSPIAFEDLSQVLDLPDGKKENTNLALYTKTMKEVAAKHRIGFIDLHTPTLELYATEANPLTINGFSLNDLGERKLAEILHHALYKPSPINPNADAKKLLSLVKDKAWFWQQDHRVLNGVHAYGRRFKPYGNVNYPQETQKIRELTTNRDEAVWLAAQGKSMNLAKADAATSPLPEVESNFKQPINYLGEAETLSKFTLMDGFKIEMFASQDQFPDLANPVQMSFDNKGRLWVAVMPSYPHYKPGDPLPNDKLLILEDTNNDGRADKQTVFADKLHLPIGFELAPEGVYVSEQPNLILLRDTDGDDHADSREYILHGFDSHDTHHANSAFSSDAAGGIYMAEGTFLHSQVETPYGPQRCVGSGIWRFDPKSFRLERYVQTAFANPWGIAFDDWDQCFIADASGGHNWWSLPLSIKVPYAYDIGKIGEFAPKRARPTSGAEFILSRHFPDKLQGGFMVNNTIGFLGTSIHEIHDDEGGYFGTHIGDIVSSSDPTYRPCDLEFAPDGSLYIIDWCNALIGHMQHSARDPNRDHTHGRVFRVTHPSRPLVKATTIAGAPIVNLLDLLREPEYRTRYRARRELRSRNSLEVVAAAKTWAAKLDPADPRHDHHLTEALWATWAQNAVDHELLVRTLSAKDPKARAAAVNVIRHSWRKIPDHSELLLKAASDPEPIVRLAAVAAASWMDNDDGARVALKTFKKPITKWMPEAMKATFVTLKKHADKLLAADKISLSDNEAAKAFLAGKLPLGEEASNNQTTLPPLSNDDLALWELGREVYSREAHCATCHQPEGNGIENLYPPLAGSEWIQGDEGRAIRITLKGIYGPITVKGASFDPSSGVPPMMGFGPMLNDKEVAGVLTYIRNSFGNKAPAVKPEAVQKIREETKNKNDFYTPDELLKLHPLPANP